MNFEFTIGNEACSFGSLIVIVACFTNVNMENSFLVMAPCVRDWSVLFGVRISTRTLTILDIPFGYTSYVYYYLLNPRGYFVNNENPLMVTLNLYFVE